LTEMIGGMAEASVGQGGRRPLRSAASKATIGF
jgi:hypothetical protein